MVVVVAALALFSQFSRLDWTNVKRDGKPTGMFKLLLPPPPPPPASSSSASSSLLLLITRETKWLRERERKVLRKLKRLKNYYYYYFFFRLEKKGEPSGIDNFIGKLDQKLASTFKKKLVPLVPRFLSYISQTFSPILFYLILTYIHIHQIYLTSGLDES